MDSIFITSIIVWIPLTFLAFAIMPKAWMNAHSLKAASYSELIAWASLASSILAFAAWLLGGQNIINAFLVKSGILGIRIDALSLPILILVTLLGAVIVRFSKNYLSGDAAQGGFIKWLMITLGAVVALALSPGLVQFWLSWVICSLGLHHLLVYFPNRLGTLLSARKKFIVSRMGDICLIIAFVGLYRIFGTQDFSELFTLAQSNPELLANKSWVGWLIVGGAVLKSAQLPFHTWLPDTLGAPTPVSALMHAGIINAGGFLIIRMSPLLVQTPSALTILAVVGAITLVGASLIMLTQNSVKRSLAYSTIAQMGFMLLQCGLGAFALATLHLVAHSLYKAHAFLSSGSSVAVIKQLQQRSPSEKSFGLITVVALLSVMMVAVMAGILDMSFSNKPGMLVLLVVLSMAVCQYIVTQLKPENTPGSMARTGIVACGFALLYLGLAAVTMRYFADTLPQMIIAGPYLQIMLAAMLGLYCFLTIVLQAAKLGHINSPLVKAIYVHALNGFYLNTLANRASRLIGLVPPGR